MNWRVLPKNDRLKRLCVVDLDSPGRGKEVIADNVRRNENATLIAAAPAMRDALAGIVANTLLVDGVALTKAKFASAACVHDGAAVDPVWVSEKTIVRQIIRFRKDRHGYFVTIAMRGYETVVGTGASEVTAEDIAIGYCTEDEFESMYKFFKSNGHTIDVC